MLRIDELSAIEKPSNLDLLELCVLKSQTGNAMKLIEKLREDEKKNDEMRKRIKELVVKYGLWTCHDTQATFMQDHIVKDLAQLIELEI
jgi:hypothetical protein